MAISIWYVLSTQKDSYTIYSPAKDRYLLWNFGTTLITSPPYLACHSTTSSALISCLCCLLFSIYSTIMAISIWYVLSTQKDSYTIYSPAKDRYLLWNFGTTLITSPPYLACHSTYSMPPTMIKVGQLTSTIFEPTCRNAWWALMRHFPSGCLWLYQKSLDNNSLGKNY